MTTTPEMFPPEGDLEPDFGDAADVPLSPEDAPDRPFEIGDELAQDGDLTDDAAIQQIAAEPEEDPEFARIFGPGTSAADDDDLLIDYDPEAGLLELGVHPRGILTLVEKTQTSGYNGKPQHPAIKWTVKDVTSGQSVSKTVNMSGGNGIERMNIEFARVFGVEPKPVQVGKKTQYVLRFSELKAAEGSACSFEVGRFGDRVPRATLENILPPSGAGIPSDAYPED